MTMEEIIQLVYNNSYKFRQNRKNFRFLCGLSSLYRKNNVLTRRKYVDI